jgi:hypothetical protein
LGSAPGSGAGLKAWPSLRVRCSGGLAETNFLALPESAHSSTGQEISDSTEGNEVRKGIPNQLRPLFPSRSSVKTLSKLDLTALPEVPAYKKRGFAGIWIISDSTEGSEVNEGVHSVL